MNPVTGRNRTKQGLASLLPKPADADLSSEKPTGALAMPEDRLELLDQ